MQVRKQVRTGHGTTDWFQLGKRARQGCILSPCLFNLYAQYITRNAGLEEAQAGIKIAERNINNLRYADNTRREWQTTSVSCLENPMNSMTNQKDLTLKDELPKSVGA